MYQQIAKNKRKTVIVVALFLLVWLGIGALVGLIAGTHTTYDYYGYAAGTTISVGAIVTGAVVFGCLALAGAAYSFTAGSRLVLAISGAQPADPVQYQQLHNVVEALAIGDGLPKPDVYVIEDPSPNAFATGTSPKRAAITATTGLLQMMNREELEGVIGHEMSHIKNFDVRLILIVSTLIGMAGVIASVVWRMAFFSSRGRNNNQAGLIIIVAGLLLGLVAVIVGPLIQLSLSRSRESLADVSGVELTRNPQGLISALQKLQQNDQPFAKFNHATAAMCIDDPLQHHATWFHHLFDTHPPIEERIAVLQRIASGHAV